VVLGIADGRGDGESFVDTAVFDLRESVRAEGAPGFANAPDTDPALPANRAWADGSGADRRVERRRVDHRRRAHRRPGIARRDGRARARRRPRWGACRPMTARSSARRRARARARRGELIEVAASETGKVFAEADVEVSEAVDFANYYAATARELDRVSGAVFVPAALTVVAPPWNFPSRSPPAACWPRSRRDRASCSSRPAGAALRGRRRRGVWEALDAEGIERDILALVDIDEEEQGSS
jgi:RHH-type proline utilization regulon transcriptional repressor/proline dehydrogenase/delta 1-pyrroline-5-carboxylate dehydrogenase